MSLRTPHPAGGMKAHVFFKKIAKNKPSIISLHLKKKKFFGLSLFQASLSLIWRLLAVMSISVCHILLGRTTYFFLQINLLNVY